MSNKLWSVIFCNFKICYGFINLYFVVLMEELLFKLMEDCDILLMYLI